MLGRTWFADIVETIGFTVFTINSLTILIKTTDSGESSSSIAVSVSLTLVRDRVTGMSVQVAEISLLQLTIIK